MAYESEANTHEVAQSVYAKLPVPWERDRLALEPLERRNTPFELRWRASVRSTTVLTVPKGYDVLPFKQGASDPRLAKMMRWNTRAEVTGSAVRVTFSYDRVPGSYPADQYGPFQRDLLAAIAILEQPVVMQRALASEKQQ